jgi:integrase
MSLRDSLYGSLNPQQQKEYVKFETAALASHVKRRDGGSQGPFVLDQRNDLLGHGPRETLRDPTHADWPTAGRSTKDADEARAWARAYYIPRLWQQRQVASVHPSADETRVIDAIIVYLRLLVQVTVNAAGRQTFFLPRKYASRLSMLRRHVIPAFGELIIATITRTMVRVAAENLVIENVDRNGRRTERAAKQSQKLNFVSALLAVWRDAFPDVPAPYAGALVRPMQKVEVASDDDKMIDVYDLDALQFELSADEGKGALDYDQVERTLVAAMYRDRELLSRPNLAGRMFANTVYLIVLLIATGARISEVSRIRWGEINWDKGFILIEQSKQHTNKKGKPKPKKRLVPLQLALIPWLRELQEASGITQTRDNTALVIRTNPAGAPQTRPALNTLINKVSRALRLAGVKIAGKATHWARSTHISWAKHSSDVNAEELKHFLGHQPFSGETDVYVAMLVKMLEPRHQRYIKLPSPDEVRAKLADFDPKAFDWRDGKTVQSRTKDAKDRRRQARLDQKAPPATLDEFILRLLS